MIFWECNFSGNVISWGNFIFQEIWLTGKCDFLLKCDFPGNLTSQQMWPSRVLLKSMGGIGLSISQKCDFPENVTSQELWLPGKCYFLGIVTSQEKWIQFDTYNIDHVCNSAAGPVYGFHIFFSKCLNHLCHGWIKLCDHQRDWQLVVGLQWEWALESSTCYWRPGPCPGASNL